MSYEFFIARRYFKAKRRTGFISVMSFLSFAGVTVGVAALIIVLSVMNGAQSELRNKILGTTAHVIILKHRNQPVTEYKELVPRINSQSGVIGSSPFIYTKCMIAKQDKVDGLVLRGVDLDLEHGVTDIAKNMVAGQMEFESVQNGLPGIILGLDLADRLGAYLGDTVLVSSAQALKPTPFGLIPKTKQFRLTGIFDAGMYEYNSTLGYIGLAEAQNFLEMGPAVTGIEVKIKDIYRAQEMGKKLTEELGTEYRYNDWIRLNWSLFSALKMEKTAMFLILALIILVAALNIVSSLIMTVIEKTREIGILKSMGATSQSIMRIFIFQGLMVGGIGTGLGMGLGYVLCLLLARYQFVKLPPDVYFINKLPVQMQAGDFMLIGGAALIITLVAAIYPAWKAARLDPIEAIRYE